MFDSRISIEERNPDVTDQELVELEAETLIRVVSPDGKYVAMEFPASELESLFPNGVEASTLRQWSFIHVTPVPNLEEKMYQMNPSWDRNEAPF